jgi:ATPase subunit of ABC transporter with duplicated ATPase domains
VAWLEQYLYEFKGTVVAVTHDRYFLDNVAGWILELDQGKGIPFEGNYSSWLESKSTRLAQEKKRKKDLEKQMAEELAYINKKQKGQQKKGKARLRKYDDLVKQSQEYTERAGDAQIVINNPSGWLGKQVVTATNLSKGYGERLLIDGAMFDIPPGAVVGIVGPNGAGKTTLFNMIMGRLEPDGGALTIGPEVQAMYVDQSRDELEGDETVLEAIGEGQSVVNIGGREIMTRAYAAWFNFTGNTHSQPVKTLSGGQRNRLQLAKTLRRGGNVLMLDEPTNDLDVDTLRALEQAIENFAGTVLCISHDRWFLDRIATHILAYEGNSQLYFFEGGWSEYEEDRMRRTGEEGPTKTEFKAMPEFTLS